MRAVVLYSKVKKSIQSFLPTRRVLLWTIIVVLLLLIPPSQGVNAQLPYPTKNEWIGRFFIANTSELQALDVILFTSEIGATTNVTISVHSNSSSGILVSFSTTRPKYYWEGPLELRLEPDQSVTVSYICHFTADQSNAAYFHYKLLESSKNASGTYQLEQVHPGYTAAFIGTSHLYVSDITLWLEHQSRIYGTPELAVGIFLLCIGLLVVISWLRRYLRRKRSNDEGLKTNES
jgi:hypothetical protein